MYKGYPLHQLGRVYLAEKDYDRAGQALHQSLECYQQMNHTDMYRPLETLGELHHTKAASQSQWRYCPGITRNAASERVYLSSYRYHTNPTYTRFRTSQTTNIRIELNRKVEMKGQGTMKTLNVAVVKGQSKVLWKF